MENEILAWALSDKCKCRILCRCGSKKAAILRREVLRLTVAVGNLNSLIASDYEASKKMLGDMESALVAEKDAFAGMSAKYQWERNRASVAEDKIKDLGISLNETMAKAREMRKHLLAFAYQLHAPEMQKHIAAAVAIEFPE